MRNKLIRYLFMLLVVVYLKDGSAVYFEKATSYHVDCFSGAQGARAIYLRILREDSKSWPKAIASFNWDVVKYVETR